MSDVSTPPWSDPSHDVAADVRQELTAIVSEYAQRGARGVFIDVVSTTMREVPDLRVDIARVREIHDEQVHQTPGYDPIPFCGECSDTTTGDTYDLVRFPCPTVRVADALEQLLDRLGDDQAEELLEAAP